MTPSAPVAAGAVLAQPTKQKPILNLHNLQGAGSLPPSSAVAAGAQMLPPWNCRAIAAPASLGHPAFRPERFSFMTACVFAANIQCRRRTPSATQSAQFFSTHILLANLWLPWLSQWLARACGLLRPERQTSRPCAFGAVQHRVQAGPMRHGRVQRSVERRGVVTAYKSPKKGDDAVIASPCSQPSACRMSPHRPAASHQQYVDGWP